MTLKSILCVTALLAATACGTPATNAPAASDPGNGSGMGDMSTEDMEAEMMMKMMEIATPGAPHAEFKEWVGEWATQSQIWMAPGATPMDVTGKSTISVTMGGRYLIENMKSDFMGQPFEGMLVMGFNNLDNTYFNLWMDSMSTGYSLATGTKNAKGEIEVTGTMKDVMTPEGRPYRSVTTLVSADEHVFTMFDTTMEGTEFKVMEIVYRRIN
jgi:hypothetical protein